MPDASTTTLSDCCRRTLRDLGVAEGDSSLSHQLAIWKHDAEKKGTRLALAERAARVALERDPSLASLPEFKTWRKAAGE